MKKICIVGGCIFAIFILILAAIPVAAITQTGTIKNIFKSNMVDRSKFSKNHNFFPTGWLPGDLIGILINFILCFILWILISLKK